MRYLTLCLVLILSSGSLFGQRHVTKTLHDSVFHTAELVALPQLFFALGKSSLRPEGVDSLRLIYLFLSKHSDLEVQIQTHTDQEDPSSSQHLTSSRACRCLDSLVKWGIAPSRISCKGFGDTRAFVASTELVLPSGKHILAGTTIAQQFWSAFDSKSADYQYLRSLNRRTEMEITHTGTDTSTQIDLHPFEYNGIYGGKSLYFLDGAKDDLTTGHTCSRQVLVNGKVLKLKNESAHEIRLDSLGLSLGDSLHIQIFHLLDCMPSVLYDATDPNTKLHLQNCRLDSTGLLAWKALEEGSTHPYEIEQFLWGRWVTVAEVPCQGIDAKTSYAFHVKIYPGENKVRLKQLDMDGRALLSTVLFCKTVKGTSQQVNVLSYYFHNQIDFSAETRYELYDSYGTLLKKGTGKSIPCINLSNGMYFLNFDNQTIDIYKR
jgi:outer membrane protein OmpA-like peptidoglycan-associated protein